MVFTLMFNIIKLGFNYCICKVSSSSKHQPLLEDDLEHRLCLPAVALPQQTAAAQLQAGPSTAAVAAARSLVLYPSCPVQPAAGGKDGQVPGG